jgi:hypothetical protein
MQKTILTTVSDDRFNRKNGLYAATQEKLYRVFSANSGFGINDFNFWRWEDIIKSDFYRENKKMLDHPNPDMNGRCYKPFAILDSLKKASDGDFIIYNDCSPEMWNLMHSDSGIDAGIYSLDVIKNLCEENGGILTADVTWVVNGEFGDHTHESFTLERCINRMGLAEYKHCLQHASGMIVLQKNKKSVDFVEEWLHWNTIDECASLGPVLRDGVDAVGEYWSEELQAYGKCGHRHDQSISGLLINKMRNKLLKCCGTYDFLSYCRKGMQYRFTESVVEKSPFIWKHSFDGSNWIYKKTER